MIYNITNIVQTHRLLDELEKIDQKINLQTLPQKEIDQTLRQLDQIQTIALSHSEEEADTHGFILEINDKIVTLFGRVEKQRRRDEEYFYLAPPVHFVEMPTPEVADQLMEVCEVAHLYYAKDKEAKLHLLNLPTEIQEKVHGLKGMDAVQALFVEANHVYHTNSFPENKKGIDQWFRELEELA